MMESRPRREERRDDRRDRQPERPSRNDRPRDDRPSRDERTSRDVDVEREREALKRSFSTRDNRQNPNDRPNNVNQHERQNNIHSVNHDRQNFDRERESRTAEKDSWKFNPQQPPPPAMSMQPPQRRPPPPQIREQNLPLPPLVIADIIPLHLRKSKLTYWDKAPAGYDGMSVVQVKMTGHFPTPGKYGNINN